VSASPADIVTAAQLACLLEASAPKPGNVSPGRRFADLGYEDFLAAAAAIGGPFSRAGRAPLGEVIVAAVDATSRWTQSNANLGIVLLLAPLAAAAVRGEGSLRDDLRRVLDATTIDDALRVYQAIRLAAPGGLGTAEEQDVATEPDRTLVDVMRLAAGRDGIAREYATGFACTFEVGVPALSQARGAGLAWDDAVVESYLTVLASQPDTHIARRGGLALAEDVSRRARLVLGAGGVRSEVGRRAIDEMDRGLRDERHTANPGTTADLTAAAIFVVLMEERVGRLAAAPSTGTP
jgi:triphosphoribosyl-dephospho-CoA synthase